MHAYTFIKVVLEKDYARDANRVIDIYTHTHRWENRMLLNSKNDVITLEKYTIVIVICDGWPVMECDTIYKSTEWF